MASDVTLNAVIEVGCKSLVDVRLPYPLVDILHGIGMKTMHLLFGIFYSAIVEGEVDELTNVVLRGVMLFYAHGKSRDVGVVGFKNTMYGRQGEFAFEHIITRGLSYLR